MKNKVNCKPLYLQALVFWQLCYQYRTGKHPMGDQYEANTKEQILAKVNETLDSTILHPTILSRFEDLRDELTEKINVKKQKATG